MSRVSIVSGGALGIGGATSRRLAARGDTVVLNDIDGDAAAATRDAIVAEGGECVVVVGDIVEHDVVAQVVETALGITGRIDVLVNNVGDFRPASKDFLRSRPEQWERLHELNLLHVLRLTHAALPHLIEQGGGAAIVNNSTVEAFRGIPGHAVYSAYNAGVSAFTKSLAVEVGRHGIRVNAIAPDLADSQQTPAAAMLNGKDPALIPTWVPMGRFGHVEEYAAVIEFLTSDAASYLTGHTIPVDGGTLAASGWYARVDGKGWTNFPLHA
ncbi:MAG TPA: SDR family NAD(P)-dependent oxidoreductase [Nocardioides sp.]|uniref:SDR family NAD(P)-dependent oxidoreductase n=1 Tax=Nocardioides sp. TaxID=35761 RepID=UPI002C218CA4|nr:SDR family NAD(P)-dependent oxidoreductase [Nocardioides sp.]HTW15338.1 SDR family NAD(P)-dependent oxidoreductase [Nocardioides sp.]